MTTSKSDRVKCPLATETDESDINCESKRQFAVGIVAKFHRGLTARDNFRRNEDDKSRAPFGQISGVESGAPPSIHVQGGTKSLSADIINEFYSYKFLSLNTNFSKKLQVAI